MPDDVPEGPGLLVRLSFAPVVATVGVPLLVFGGVTAWLAAVAIEASRPGELGFPAVMLYSFALVISAICAAATTFLGIVMAAFAAVLHPPSRPAALRSVALNLAPTALAFAGYVGLSVLGVIVAAAVG